MRCHFQFRNAWCCQGGIGYQDATKIAQGKRNESLRGFPNINNAGGHDYVNNEKDMNRVQALF